MSQRVGDDGHFTGGVIGIARGVIARVMTSSTDPLGNTTTYTYDAVSTLPLAS